MEAARVAHIPAARSAGVPGTRGRPFFIVASFAVALLMTVASLGGILLPATYSQESVNWAAQAVGQDWVDLLIAVPWLAITATLVLNGSRRSLFLLAGGLLYTLYEFVIYGLAVHFNSLFLVYCAVLGLAFFALTGVAIRLMRDDEPRSQASAPAKTAGTFLLVIAVLFGALWLSDIVPALARGTIPRSILEAQVPTNPVYVMDLAVILPLHVGAGAALLLRRRLGFVLAPPLLAFDVLMALSIAGMMLVMRQRGVDASMGVAAAMGIVSATSIAILAALLRRFEDKPVIEGVEN